MRGTGRKPRSTRVQDLRVALSCITRPCLSLLERTSIGRKTLTKSSYRKCPFHTDERSEDNMKRDPAPKFGAAVEVPNNKESWKDGFVTEIYSIPDRSFVPCNPIELTVPRELWHRRERKESLTINLVLTLKKELQLEK